MRIHETVRVLAAMSALLGLVAVASGQSPDIGHENGGAGLVDPLVTNDVVIFGILISILAFVFWTHSLANPILVRFYKIFPLLLLCYFLPSLLTLFGVVDPELSKVPGMAKSCLLPASLVLLTLSTDFSGSIQTGPQGLDHVLDRNGRRHPGRALRDSCGFAVCTRTGRRQR